MYFHSIVYTIYMHIASDVKSAHTHIKCFVRGCKVPWLMRGRYGVNINHMIPLESLESILNKKYIIPPIHLSWLT